MNGYYSSSLVALSIAIAILASYTALDLANRVSTAESTPRKASSWLGAGAISMGSGIWSMHFIGMLAFHLPTAVAYDLPITALSLIVAIMVSAIALFILRKPQLQLKNVLCGALLMGVGISVMHYMGMIAMQMSPRIEYDPALFMASVAIAVAASLAALWLASTLRRTHSRFAIAAKLGSAGVMGLAIAGMHYTGMAAARFAPGSICLAATADGIGNTTLAVIVGCLAFAILSVTLILSAIDAHFAIKNARFAASLQVAKDAADAALQQNERITRELREAQSGLVASARYAGMAEIATNVLHDVGNVLNSVNVSAGLIATQVRESKLEGFARAMQLMNQHSSDLGEFLTRDEKGRRLPDYLSQLLLALTAERERIAEETTALTKSVNHIRDIVATQQSYAAAPTLLEPVLIADLLSDALRMNVGSMMRHRIAIVRQVADVPPVLLDKHLLLQILINLISNAKQAMDGAPDVRHQILLRASVHGAANQRRLRIAIEDNGEGIPPENLQRLFLHGFTTRKSGHGFGLHGSVLAAQAMGGTLTAHSDGVGRGATFVLELPLNAIAVAVAA